MSWLVVLLVIFLVAVWFKYPHLLNLLLCPRPGVGLLKCFKYKTVHAQAPSPLAKAEAPLQLWPEHLHNLALNNTLAFLIVRKNQIVLERYFDIQPQTRVNSFSAVKTLVSLLIGIGIDEGRIPSLDWEIEHYFPQFRGSKVTIRHLLSMSSGIRWSEKFNNPFSHVLQAFYTNNLQPLVERIKPEREPGIWSYQCGNTLLLAQILEIAFGQSLERLVEQRLWVPLGAEQHALWASDKHGRLKAFCCFFAIARDFAKVGALILNNGNWNGKQLVSEDYIRQMTRAAGVVDAWGKSVPYGLHIWVGEYKGLHFSYLRGMFGQYVIILPQLEAVVVRLGNKRVGQDENYLARDLNLYLDVVIDLLGFPSPKPNSV